MLSRLSVKTGSREYSCSCTSLRRSSIVAVARIGDDVRARRHDFADERLAEIHDRSQQAALVAAPARAGVSSARAAAAGICPDPARARGSAPPSQRDDERRDRPEHVRHGGEERQEQLQHALGRSGPADDDRGQHLADADGDRRRRSERASGSRPTSCRSARPAARSTAPAASPRMIRAGTKNLSGSSRYAASASPSLSRSASRRCGSRMSSPNAVSTTAKNSSPHEARKTSTPSSAPPRRARDERRRQPRPTAAAAPPPSPSGHRPAHGRSRASAAGRAARECAARCSARARAREPAGGRRQWRWRGRRETGAATRLGPWA